jgi:hypothetical protein
MICHVKYTHTRVRFFNSNPARTPLPSLGYCLLTSYTFLLVVKRLYLKIDLQRLGMENGNQHSYVSDKTYNINIRF